MSKKNESWLDTLTREEIVDYMVKKGVTKIDKVDIESHPSFGKYVYMTGLKDGLLYVEARGEFAPMVFGYAKPVEDFSGNFYDKNGKLEMTDDASNWIETVARANEGRTIVDENGVAHNYLDSFVYAFLKQEGAEKEKEIENLQNTYIQERNAVAELYCKITNQGVKETEEVEE